MSRHITIITGISIFLFGGCIFLRASDTSKNATEPRPLTALNEKYRKSAAEVSEALIKSNEKPDEFVAVVEENKDGQVLIFHLWHSSAFKPENKNVAGNPGGKCRDMYYDTKTLSVYNILFWK